MHNALGDLLAKVSQGHLSPHEAKALAAAKWVNGNVPAEDLPMFAVEVAKLHAERETARYVESVVARSWSEIEQIIRSPFLSEATREKIRSHPEAQAKRATMKMATFGQRYALGPNSIVYTGFARLSLADITDRWLKSYPEIAQSYKGVRIHPGNLASAHELGTPAGVIPPREFTATRRRPAPKSPRRTRRGKKSAQAPVKRSQRRSRSR